MPEELETQKLDDNCSREPTNTLNIVNVTQSPIQNIVPEILGTIFQYACLTQDFHESIDKYTLNVTDDLRQSRQHIFLAAVSSFWRQVVHSTPQLWTSVVLRHDDARFLELHVTRSGNLHLSLEIWNESRWLKPSPSAGCHILSKVAPKLKSLILVNLGDGAAECISDLEFPFLKKLGIICQAVHTFQQLKLPAAPVLQHISFHTELCFDILDFELPWSSITSLDLKWIPIPICITALRRCHNLVELRYEEFDYGEEHLLQASLTLPCLKQLRWRYFRETTMRNVLQHFRTPVLQSLLLGFEKPVDEAWIKYFQNLPTTFHNLHLYTFSAQTAPDMQYPSRLFECIPDLEELVLEECARDFIEDVLAALSLHGSSSGAPVYLPKLQTLVIGPPPTELSDLRRRMTEMVEKRFSGRARLPVFSTSAVLWKCARWKWFRAAMLVING